MAELTFPEKNSSIPGSINSFRLSFFIFNLIVCPFTDYNSKKLHYSGINTLYSIYFKIKLLLEEKSIKFILSKDFFVICNLKYAMIMENKAVVAKKVKYQMEFEIKSSPKILFPYISTPSGLEEWFADKVNIRDGIYYFNWEGSEAKAKLASRKDNTYVRFKWLDSEDDSYFQFEIQQDDLTSDVALIVTDFSPEDDIEENKLLWDTQVHHLMHLLGS